MGSVFHVIYCMNIPQLLLLIAVLTVLFAYFLRKFRHTLWCKAAIRLLLLSSITAIFCLTLLSRETHTEAPDPSLIPFISYQKAIGKEDPELLRSCFMNVLLFYPAGLLSTELFPQKWHPLAKVLPIVFLFALMSTGVEYAQYAYKLGQPEVDDVIHNTLGALIGGNVGVWVFSEPDVK